MKQNRRDFLKTFGGGLGVLVMGGSLDTGSSDVEIMPYDRNAVFESLKSPCHEGYRTHVYDDATKKSLYPGESARGNRTIGVGFNLEDSISNYVFCEAGIDERRFEDLYYGRADMTDSEINKVLEIYVKNSEEETKTLLEGKWNGIDGRALEVAVEFNYWLGNSRSRSFKNFWRALRNGDYRQAAEELKDSYLYKVQGKKLPGIRKRINELAKKLKNIK